MPNATPDNIAAVVMAELEKYRGIAIETVKTAAENAGKTVQEQIRSTAPVLSGKYAKSWKTKVTKNTDRVAEVTVYSPTQYRLAHLLEHGHAKRGGGRTDAQVHIQPAEQEGIAEFEREIRRGLRNE